MSVLSSRLGADCTAKCHSSGHCQELTTALSHCTGDQDVELAVLAFVARHCHNTGRARDPMGRGLVHAAVSGGLLSVLQWLLNKGGRDSAGLNSKDGENGYSPLHRAVFHGQLQVVVFLMKEGANLALCDNDGMTALDHLVLDRPLHVTYERQAPLEAYVWGTNSNYNLGLGSNTTRNQPDILEQFRREGLCVDKVALSKFHSAFVTRAGVALTCGHGRGGRLGHGSETMQLVPRTVNLSSPCLDVALGVDHSVFLVQGGAVFTCGMNNYHQLGHHPPPSLLLAPAPITPRGSARHPPAVGVSAARFHSVFWSQDSVYTWGLNAGQLGHMKGDKTVTQPKLVASLASKENKISQVFASDGATVVLTAKGDVVALYEYGSKKLGQRQHNISQLQVTGGHLDPQVDPGGPTVDEIDFKLVAGGGSNLKVFLLTKTGRISVWEDSRENQFIPCLFSLSREVVVTDLALHRTGLVLVSKGGEAWTGLHQTHQAGKRAQSPTSTRTSTTLPTTDLIKLKRLPHIHRAVSTVCDPKGRNFCVLQVSPHEALTEVPEISPCSMSANLKRLLDDCSDGDQVHDVICVLGKVRLPAHGFVLASGSELFAKQLKYVEDECPIVIEIDDIKLEIFQQVLQFLYYKDCDLFKVGPCPIKISEDKTAETSRDILEINGDPAKLSAFQVYSENKSRKKKNNKSKNEVDISSKKINSSNPLVLLQEAAKSLGVYGLSKIADCFRVVDGNIVRKSTPPKSRLDFANKNFPDLHDVTITTEEDKDISAHKCILVARSEYFYGMFNSGWVESSSTLKLPLPGDIVQTVVDFLYRDESAQISKADDLEFVSNVLVVADQFLMTRLKEICECQLIKLLTLKNSAEILQFAFNYAAVQLQNGCMQFICLNLSAILENKSLEVLEPDVFSLLDKFYKGSNPTFKQRRVRPISGYPTLHDIKRDFSADPITSEELEAAEELVKLNSKSRTRRHSSGDKRRSPRVRHSSTESFSSGSNSDDDSDIGVDNFDKLNLSDFDIEEKLDDDPSGSPVPTATPCVESASDKSFFSSLLNQPVVETFKNTPQNTERKKPGKISQKERKRLSLESEKSRTKVAITPITPSPKSSWSGWGQASSSSEVTSSPSLVDIMKMEDKSPTGLKSSKSTEEFGTKRVSETDKKPEKRTSWRQMNWTGNMEKSKSATPTKAITNPWNIPVGSPNNNTTVFKSLESHHSVDESFHEIMKEDVIKKENLYKSKSKPLSVTQIEEKAIEELKAFYNAESCYDEIITVSRVETVAMDTPVWRKLKK